MYVTQTGLLPGMQGWRDWGGESTQNLTSCMPDLHAH